jgi:hypothetical protein
MFEFKTYWLSFAKKKEFLGFCIIQAETPEGALDKSHKLNINPGGEVAIWECEKEAINIFGCDKLNHPRDFPEIVFTRLGDLVSDELNQVRESLEISLCEHCNQTIIKGGAKHVH